jgi:hypothetical protein
VGGGREVSLARLASGRADSYTRVVSMNVESIEERDGWSVVLRAL